MRRIAVAIVAVIVIVFLAGLAFIYSGVYNVAAASAQWPFTVWAIETTRTRSVEAHAAGIPVPQSLDDEAKIVGGAAHYADHCAVCHGAPGGSTDEIAGGMYPPPPDLTHVSRRFTPPELFWILKNGIKMTGMPSWADHSDEELWNTVAFLEKLPEMSPDGYKRLVAAAMAQPGYDHMKGPAGTIAVEKPWARATPLGAQTAVVYMTIVNNGPFGDRLTGASTPAAGKVSFHSEAIENGIMRMGGLSVIEIRPGEHVVLKPGGNHAMLADLKERLAAGQEFPLKLEFERAGKVEATVHVESIGAMGPK